ncbi:unannotated protein [freshwater metagenome]|uniref:Unannotated protein n=1 Tax=freshwater metagenome TaxID=449393 RepID=A0A6J6WSP2_9ZZZZ
MQSLDSHVSFVLEVNGFFTHLYLLPLTVVVALSFVHAAPFETLAAAVAGAATITPAATTSATVTEANLRI